jgi:hypothetical protein
LLLLSFTLHRYLFSATHSSLLLSPTHATPLPFRDAATHVICAVPKGCFLSWPRRNLEYTTPVFCDETKGVLNRVVFVCFSSFPFVADVQRKGWRNNGASAAGRQERVCARTLPCLYTRLLVAVSLSVYVCGSRLSGCAPHTCKLSPRVLGRYQSCTHTERERNARSGLFFFFLVFFLCVFLLPR